MPDAVMLFAVHDFTVVSQNFGQFLVEAQAGEYDVDVALVVADQLVRQVDDLDWVSHVED